MKNNKGITLVTLVVMIIIILILVSVGTSTGLQVIRQSEFNRAVAEMKAMQTKINEMYEDYKGGENDDLINFGTSIYSLSPREQLKAENAITSVYGETYNTEDFKYYSADYIKNNLDIDGVEGDYVVNIKTREVLLIDGTKKDKEKYYSLSQIEGEQFNVEYINPEIAYSPDGGMYVLPKNITNDNNLNMEIELSLQDIPYSMSASDLKVEYSWSTSKDTEPNDWTELEDETNITETGNSNITQPGEYYLWTRIIDNTDNKVLNTIVSKKYTIKKEYDINVRVAFDANGGTGDTASINAINNEPYGELPTPTREGYIFEGWYTDITGGTKVESTDNLELDEENLPPTQPQSQTLYAHWEEDAAYFNGNNSSSKLAEITSIDNIKRFEKYTGSDSNAQTLIDNGTAVKLDDNTTIRSIYGWFDNDSQTIYWWTDAYKTYLLDKSHYMWRDLNNAEYINVNGIETSKVTTMANMFDNTGYNSNTFEIVGLNTFDTSNVTTMQSMFSYAGYTATTWTIGDLSNWNTSQVTNMQDMFALSGYNAPTWNIGNLNSWNTSKVTTMQSMFATAGYSATTWDIGDLSSWDTSKVTNMESMFNRAGYNAETFNIGNIGNWNVSKVTNMQHMFLYSGYNSTTWNIGNLSNWNTSQVTSMKNMFDNSGYNATTWNIGNINNWNTLNVVKMEYMFRNAGYKATTWNIGNLDGWNTSSVTTMLCMFYNSGFTATAWSIGNLNNWNTSSVTTMKEMFYGAGRNATTWNIGQLDNWNTSNVNNMQSMFYTAGYNAGTFNIGNLNSWNTSNVTTMRSMFYTAGYNAGTFNIGNLNSWNTSNVTTMQSMFSYAGYTATTWSIGNLNNWDTSKVTTMENMFNEAGKNATNWNSFGTLKIYASNITNLFSGCKNANGTLNIYNNPTNYTKAFNSAATSGSGITVNYKSTVTNIDNIIATKSATSQIIKGNVLN